MPAATASAAAASLSPRLSRGHRLVSAAGFPTATVRVGGGGPGVDRPGLSGRKSPHSTQKQHPPTAAATAPTASLRSGRLRARGLRVASRGYRPSVARCRCCRLGRDAANVVAQAGGAAAAATKAARTLSRGKMGSHLVEEERGWGGWGSHLRGKGR